MSTPAELGEMDAALARLMGWTDVHCVREPYVVPEWRGKPPESKRRGWYEDLPAYSSDPAASAELKRWLWASGKYEYIRTELFTGSTGYRDVPSVEVVMLQKGGNDDHDRVVECLPLGPDPVAAECESLARCALAALSASPTPAGDGRDGA